MDRFEDIRNRAECCRANGPLNPSPFPEPNYEDALFLIKEIERLRAEVDRREKANKVGVHLENGEYTVVFGHLTRTELEVLAMLLCVGIRETNSVTTFETAPESILNQATGCRLGQRILEAKQEYYNG